LQDLIEARLRRGRSALIQHAGRRLFLDVQVPAVWLFAIGATDIAQTPWQALPVPPGGAA
jgi:hypothetical protein